MQKSGLIAASGITALIAIVTLTLSSDQVDARQKSKAVEPAVTSEAPVVLELFTSQGCSSCPPADRLASELAKDPALLVISRPVNYWDRLGWKDTLGKQENTDLQRAYARKGNEGAGVYTPQIVVDGRHGAVGSNRRSVLSLARNASMNDKPTLAAHKAANGAITVSISGTLPRDTKLSLLALSAHESVEIARGENGGRTISYTNVLIDETPLTAPTARYRNIRIAPELMQNGKADRYAVILRHAKNQRILVGRML